MPPPYALRHPILPHQVQKPSRTTNSPTTPLTDDSHQSKSGYFSRRSPTTPIARLASPSDGASSESCLTLSSNPCYQSPSHDNSVHNTTNNSLENSQYLTPPEARSESSDVPFQFHGESSGCLDMTCQKKIIKILAGTKSQTKKRRRASYDCEIRRQHEIRENEYPPSGWLFDRRTTTFAPRGFTHDLDHHIFRNEVYQDSIHLMIDEHDEFRRRLPRPPTPPVMTRRWSSGLTRAFGNSQCGNFNLIQHSSTWQPQTTQVDIVQAVRRKLTRRKVTAATALEMPDFVTCRRASNVAAHSPTPSLSKITERSTDEPLSLQDDNGQARGASIYLITSRDVDSIAQLIEKTLSKNRHKSTSTIIQVSEPNSALNTKSSFVQESVKHPSLTTGGLQPRPSVTADVVTTVADFQPTRPLSSKGMVSSDKEWRRGSTITKIVSKKSVHQIIWEGGSRGGSSTASKTSASTGDCSEGISVGLWENNESHTMRSSEQVPFSMTTRTFLNDMSSPTEQPFSERVFHWEFKEVPIDIEPILDLGSKVGLLSPTSEDVLQGLRFAESQPSPDEITSFPALPNRQSTKDWIPTPPDIATTTRPSVAHKDRACALYEAGIDAVGSVSVSPELLGPAIKSAPNKPTIKLDGFTFESSGEQGKLHASPRIFHPSRSIVLRLPQSVTRVEQRGKLGHAIGASTGAKRKSSTRPTRIRFESLNADEDLEDRKPWKKPRKDSAYPTRRSVSASPEEGMTRRQSLLSDCGVLRRASRSYEQLGSEAWTVTRKSVDRAQGEFSVGDQDRWKDRKRVIEESSPKIFGTDEAGIYNIMTGARVRREYIASLRRTSEGREVADKEKTGVCVGRDGDGCLGEQPLTGNWSQMGGEQPSPGPSVDWIG